MNIYFCGSIAGGRDYLETYIKMVFWLKRRGHNVLTEHIIANDVLNMENQLTAEHIYERDVQWLKEADAVIAEVSNPSLGVGYEICYSLYSEKSVLALYRKGIFVSRMITGNTHPNLLIKEYSTDSEWQKEIDTFIFSDK